MINQKFDDSVVSSPDNREIRNESLKDIPLDRPGVLTDYGSKNDNRPQMEE